MIIVDGIIVLLPEVAKDFLWCKAPWVRFSPAHDCLHESDAKRVGIVKIRIELKFGQLFFATSASLWVDMRYEQLGRHKDEGTAGPISGARFSAWSNWIHVRQSQIDQFVGTFL